MTPPTSAARTIAAGGNPEWTHTVTHPRHGELTFRGRLPLAMKSLQHSIAVDNLLQEISPGVEPSFQTKVVAAAIAGMSVPDGAPAGQALLIDLPVVSRTEDPDDEAKVHVQYYDAGAEANVTWLAEVWMEFGNWRNEQLSDETVAAVGESSGGPITSSGESSTPSAEATAPPSPTPAS